jgi:polyisoprenoid-binding protein YceI
MLHRNLLALVLAAMPAVLPAADHYVIDPEHTYPSIEFAHMGLSTWRGKFNRTTGRISIDRAARTGSVEVSVDTASINFGLPRMEDKARGEDAFDVVKFPVATYRGTLQFVGDEPKSVEGELTLLGVTRPVRLSIESMRCMPHPLSKKEVCGADAVGELDWRDFGMRIGRSGATRVRLLIQVEALREEAAPGARSP